MLGYRSTFTVADPRDSVVDRVRGIMVRWSEAKHGEVLGPHGLDDLVPGSRVSPAPSLEFFLVDTTEESGDRIMGFVCVESNGRDAWTSQVMVAGPEESGRTVIAVDIDAQSASTEPSRPTTMGVPRFVRNMLEEFDCDDNGITLSNDPRVLHAEDVDTLIKELGEDDHHGLVLVAGTPEDFPVDRWKSLIDSKVTCGTAGQSAVYVLDAKATEAFNAKVSPRHEVLPGGLRTFLPGAHLNEPQDGIRHKFLVPGSIADDVACQRAARAIERRARNFTNERAQDRQVRRYRQVLDRHLDDIVFAQSAEKERRRLAVQPSLLPNEAYTAIEQQIPTTLTADALTSQADQVTPVPRADATVIEALRVELAQVRSEAESLRTEAGEHQRALLAAETTNDEIRQRLASSANEVERLNEQIEAVIDERDLLKKAHEDLELELAIAIEETDKSVPRMVRAQREILRLRRLLEDNGLSAEAWNEAPEAVGPERPSSWNELAVRASSGHLEGLPGVTFTCDWDIVADLDDHSDVLWLTKTWQILQVLSDYARARADSDCGVKNLHTYLQETPPGYLPLPASKYKPRESDTVTNRPELAKERMFPVPVTVPGRDRNGCVFMQAHFVIAQSSMVSPRLYLYDATRVRGCGDVIVGYIGPHLRNAHTN